MGFLLILLALSQTQKARMAYPAIPRQELKTVCVKNDDGFLVYVHNGESALVELKTSHEYGELIMRGSCINVGNSIICRNPEQKCVTAPAEPKEGGN
jgi:hypothetical protein